MYSVWWFIFGACFYGAALSLIEGLGGCPKHFEKPYDLMGDTSDYEDEPETEVCRWAVLTRFLNWLNRR